jgi:ferredoxin
VRSCELNALGIQDKIFATTAYADPYYKTIREDCLIIAVNCVRAGGTCFCSSMKTGPQCDSGYDIVITEVNGRSIHHFVVEAGTDKGKELLAQCITRPAEEKECERAKQLIAEAAKQMGRALDTANLKELLYRNFENSRWDEISTKCLTCGNCTMVCPTCFCSIVEELTDLAGENADRWRKWDTCFRIDFAYIHGGSIRSTPRSRYRQWMTHKFASWIDQFGAFGCVGCGRCITWCPVGIDITAEINLIRQSETTK